VSAATLTTVPDRLADRIQRAVVARVRAEIASGEARLAAGLALSFLLHALAAAAWMGTPESGQGGRSSERVTVRIAPGPPSRSSASPQAAVPRIAQGVTRASDTKPRPTATPDAVRTAAIAPPVATTALPATGPLPVENAPSGDLAAGAVYLPASALDRRPMPEEEPALEHPADAPLESGYLVLRVLVNELGTVDGVEVLVSDPEGVFDAAATRAFSAVRYRPGERHGVAVKSEMIVEVKFDAPTAPPIRTLAVTPPARP
jgi:TonB family protein